MRNSSSHVVGRHKKRHRQQGRSSAAIKIPNGAGKAGKQKKKNMQREATKCQHCCINLYNPRGAGVGTLRLSYGTLNNQHLQRAVAAPARPKSIAYFFAPRPEISLPGVKAAFPLVKPDRSLRQPRCAWHLLISHHLGDLPHGLNAAAPAN